MYKKFYDACNKIEDDRNFGISLTLTELKNIASQKLVSEDHPITIEVIRNYEGLGRLYKVLKADCMLSNSKDSSNWLTFTTQIFVHYNEGSLFFYNGEDFALQHPLCGLSLDKFLGKPVLITKEDKAAAVRGLRVCNSQTGCGK